MHATSVAHSVLQQLQQLSKGLIKVQWMCYVNYVELCMLWFRHPLASVCT
jgi:hypothetical protein